MSRIVYTVIIVALYMPTYGQVSKNFTWYDQETYRLYLAQEWSQLIEVGEEAISSELDYFYLRLRLGVAYYSIEKYRRAISHFKKALKFNAGDPLTVEYLYYAYVWAGRMGDANLIWEKHKNSLKTRGVKSPNGFITGIYTEGGIKMTAQNSDGVGNMSYFHFGIIQQLGSRINLYQGYTNVIPTIIELQAVPYTGGGPPRSYIQEVKYTFPQNEYYTKVDIPISYGLRANLSYHLQVLHDSLGNKYRNQGFEIGINQSYRPVDIYLGYAHSYINSSSQNQIMGKLTIYPLDNESLYLQGQYTYHLENKIINDVYGLKIGGKVSTRFWLEGYGSYGGVKNFQEYEGFYLYNLPHKINYKWGVNGYIFIGRTVKLSIGYMLENKEQMSESNTNFNQNYVFLGLTLNFKKR